MDWHPGLAPDTVTVLWCTTDGDERRQARTLLLRTAAAMLGVPSSEIWLEHEPSGRPFLGGAGRTLRVSVAHARGALAVALTAAGPVGVDVEVVRGLRADALARAWLHDAEAAWIGELPEADRSAAFLWLWTQKEAVGKALGLGLRAGGMSRRVPVAAQWPPDGEGMPVPRALPGARGVASAAALVDRNRHVIGVAVGDGTDGGPVERGVRVLVHRVASAPPG
ncbi:4'-phosphopantetheinyl transferase superfamily protein [Streptomyces sp. NPDC033538]|uniref:4'-phosphopantetheinyl transferase family protein n=1 Tax=Streptomyces sp. NPDC033538 TaxID=3155367 RepID=UPI0033C4B202